MTAPYVGSRKYQQTLQYRAPGAGSATAIMGNLYRKGRHTDPGIDDDGSLITDWVLSTPADVLVAPMGEVLDPDTGLLFWVHGVVEPVPSLLRGVIDHREVKLKNVYRPTLTVDILRDSDATDYNEAGDPIPTSGATPPERTGVTASLIERTQVEPTDTDLRTLTTWVGWVADGTDVRINDRLRVATSGEHLPAVGSVFRVDGLTKPIFEGLRELRLDLTRVT